MGLWPGPRSLRRPGDAHDSVELLRQPVDRVLGAEYTLLGPTSGLTTYCPADPEPGRRQTCLRRAEHLLDGADNLLGLKIAIRLGERSGVPEARLAALRVEAEALLNAGTMTQLITAGASGATFDCASLARATADLERQSRIGEPAALRARQRERVSPGEPR